MANYSSPSAASLFAGLPDQLREWLPWVTKIRFVIISFVFAIDFAIRTLVANPKPRTSGKRKIDDGVRVRRIVG